MSHPRSHRNVGCLAGFLFIASSAQGQAEIPDGFEVVEILRSSNYVLFPRINNCGEIAFTWRLGSTSADEEIFHYDNGSLVRITHDQFRDRGVRINEHGDMVWPRTTLPPGSDQIILWRGNREWIVDECGPEDLLFGADISDLGWVAWARGPLDCSSDLMIWDGQSTRRISERNDVRDKDAAMNGLGDVAWTRMDSCANPWTSQIRLSADGKRSTLPSDRLQVQVPSINNLRQIAWLGDGGIEIWENGRTRVLTDSGGRPHLNDHGDVGFWRWHDDISTAQVWLYRSKDDRFFRLVDDPRAEYSSADVNDWGEAVWGWLFGPRGREYGVHYMRRIRTGDARFDGRIDASDYRVLADCMTGPGRIDRLCDCRFLDIDYDGDVDLGDFARFQNAYGGP